MATKSRANDSDEITLALIEKCLDRLAVIMLQDREHAPRMLPIFERLEEEAANLRRKEEALERAFVRGREVKARKNSKRPPKPDDDRAGQ
jgi:hypothetical protein